MKIEINKEKILIDFEGAVPRYADNVTDIIKTATDSWLKTYGRYNTDGPKTEVK